MSNDRTRTYLCNDANELAARVTWRQSKHSRRNTLTMSTSENQVHEESLWFGTADRPLFGRLASPLMGTSLGGVLLSPPIGREARLARRCLRSLAILLAMDGYVTLRFDHFATGNSSGTFEDDGFDRAWFEGVNQATELLRSLGSSTVSAVGMRMGATIMGAAAAEYDLELGSAVLWDPCESGRTYLREASALGGFGREIEAPESSVPVKMQEYVYPDDASTRLSAVNLLAPASGPLAQRVLMVVRDDRVISSKFRTRWSEQVEWETTSEQGSLLETELPSSVQPTSTIARIREWLTAPESPATPFQVEPRAPDTIVVNAPNAYPVRERFVQLGPHKLFGVLSEPVGDVRGPLIVMVSGINEDHVGPSRLWVELSRRWAGVGLRCARFDLRELGESPWLPGQPNPPVFDKTRPDDIRDAVNALSPTNPSESVLIGLCSGAQLALGAALEFKSRGVCIINPQVGTGLLRTADRLDKSDRSFIRSFMRRCETLLKRHRWVGQMVRQVSRLVLATATSPKVRKTLARNETEMLLLASPADFSPFPWMPIIGTIDARRLVSSERFRVEVISDMDHDFLSDVGRDQAVDILEHHVREKFSGAPSD
jgi:pimeloyl-ACP methyl ester carboxylesterase